MRKKIVLMTGGTETLDYFSRQMNYEFIRLGYHTFLFDQQQEEESSEALAHFCGMSDSILVTFNYEGIHYETSLFDGEGNWFWEKYDIFCVNIIVDHPFYSPELLAIHPKKFCQVCIDRFHVQYMKEHYPELTPVLFLPLGGTSLFPDGNYPDISHRPYDVVFPGNFTPKETFEPYITRLGKEYETFYRSIIQELIAEPDTPDDQLIEAYLRKEFPDASNQEMIETMGNMIFIDTYIRFNFREKVVRTLLESGIKVHCIGAGWDKLSCRHPENLTYEEGCDSLQCLKRMSQAKLSLNVMPWFKDGAHDRVFNAMANGSVCITDHSKYLDEILSDGKNVLFYDLKETDALPEKVDALLQNPDKLTQLAKNGYSLTMTSHTWDCRAKALHEKLLRFL